MEEEIKQGVGASEACCAGQDQAAPAAAVTPAVDEVPATAVTPADAATPEVDEVPDEIAAALEARASFYETLAALYFMPLKHEDVERMAAADFSAYAELNEDFADGVNDITRYLRKRNTGTRDEMAVDFTGAFAGVKAYEGKVAVPYKSVFTNVDGLLYQEGYEDVYKAFKAECVRKREGLDYPDDHISFMCEFMALLSRRALTALQGGDAARALHELEVSRDFLENNIRSWFDDFMERALLIVKTRFYKGVLKISRGFFALDRETLDDLIDVVGGAAA